MTFRKHNRTNNSLVRPTAPTRRTAAMPMLRSEVAIMFTKKLDDDLARTRDDLKKLADKLVGGYPLEGLEWSLRQFEAAATQKVLLELKAVVDERGWDALPAVREGWLDTIVTKAQYVEASTSATSNLADRYLLAAVAKVYRASFGGFSQKMYTDAPVTTDEAIAMRQQRQAEYDAEYGAAVAEYDQKLREYKAAKSNKNQAPTQQSAAS